MLRSIALVVALLICGPAIAQGTGGGSSTCPRAQLPVDSNGWTVWPAPTTGSTFYVSDALGDATYDGTQPTHTTGTHGPFLTLAQVVTQANLDDGKDDHFLLRKGDTFQD